MTEVNLKECCIHPVTYAQALMNRAEAAEKDRDEFREVARITFDSLARSEEMRVAAEATSDELRTQLATVTERLTSAQNEIVYLRRNLDVARQQAGEQADHNQLKAWYTARMSGDQRGFDEWQSETPLGQMLDGIGDEVEP